MIYDIKTKNISFLKVSKQLKDHGVKNNKFMLVLYDESLVGIDPYSDDLTAEQQIRIYKEICMNRWYYLREIVRIPTTGSDGIQYELNLGNCAQSYAYWRNLNFITILPRQQGKTIGVICDDSWTMLFGSKNCQIIYLNKQYPDAVENGRRFKNIKNLLPQWLLKIVLDGRNDKDNQDEKYISKLKNQILIKPSANSDEQADKLGRGLTSSIIFMDEHSFQNKNSIIYDACVPAWKTAAENAAKNGVPYGIHLTTTPNNIDTPSGAFSKRVTNEACRFSFQMYDMTEEELHEYVDLNSSNNFVFIQYTWKEIGRSEQWYKSMKKQMADRIKVKRELDLEWPKSSDNSLFTEEQLDAMFLAVQPLQYSISIDKYQIDFYEKPDFTKNYLIGCDVSGGTAQDNSAISIVDPKTFHVIGNFKNSKIDTDSFRNLIKKLMLFYFGRGILIIERNSYGKNILDTLMKEPSIEPRMYREYKDRTAERVTENGMAVKSKRKTLVYGVDTTSASRKDMFDMLPGIVDDETECISSPLLYEDIKNLIVLPNGRIEADQGFHDDILMSYLIIRYAIYYGKYLQQKFGIQKFASSSNGEKGTDGESALKMINRIAKIEQKANMPKTPEVIQMIEYDKHIKQLDEINHPNRHSSMLDKIAKWNS